MHNLIYSIILAISIAYSDARQKTWPCIAGECPGLDPNKISCTGPYGCDPPACRRDAQISEDCAGLECRNGFCKDNYPLRAPTGQSCGSHAGCLNNHLCENGVCTRTTLAGSFEICDNDQNCRVDLNTQNTRCLKYDTTQSYTGVCVLKSLDPANTPPTQSQNRATNCEQNRYFCIIPLYQKLMKENCAQTCRDAGVNLRCIDKHPNCVNWVSNGFCEIYTSEQIREKCQKSCNLC